jgi:Rad3-related DNA helicase
VEPQPKLPTNWKDYFPLPVIRPKQEKALDFVFRMIGQGIKDIVIAAPTGSGKSAIGAAVAFWTGQKTFPLTGDIGAYYLCTQKLLQDQLENDILRYPANLQSSTSLKTAAEYACSSHGNCGAGLIHKPVCSAVPQHTCAYRRQVKKFLGAQLAITNYPYFLTERFYVKQFPQRRVLIADEAHTLENQMLKFVELIIGPEEIVKFLPTAKEVPEMETLDHYMLWLVDVFLPGLSIYRDSFAEDTANLTPQRAKQLLELDNMTARVERALNDMDADPNNWIFWQELNEKLPGMKERTAIAKPLSAAPYFQELLRDSADVRIYMSAYLGPKDIFCQTLGLDPDATAMLSLGSVFAKEHRPIHAALVGSMSRKNQQETLPRLLRVLGKILDEHAGEKGIIHGNSYALCQSIFDHFLKLPQGKRLLFPRNADERENVYKTHRESKTPTVILSPSFTEGFDFTGDAARWQVIAKIPFPFLGDRQVMAKKEKDPEWYMQRTVSTIVQASGRICRHENDFGLTYITDSDFQFLWEKWNWMFPNWWKEALIWH